MASKTIELRKDIQALLKTVTAQTFYRRATDTALYPYVVYTIEDIFGAKMLKVDIWDKDSSTLRIETIADSIETLKDEIIKSENHTVILYYNEDRQWVDDEDKQIQRINLSFELRYYGKER